MNMPPWSGSSTSGVSSVTTPTFDALGQAAPGAEKALSAAYCDSVQGASPAPTAGLIVIPSGRAKTAFLIPAWLGESWTSKPVGEAARAEVGRAETSATWPSWSQPSRVSVAADLLAVATPGCGQLSTLSPKVGGLAQVVGIVRYSPERLSFSAKAGGQEPNGAEGAASSRQSLRWPS